MRFSVKKFTCREALRCNSAERRPGSGEGVAAMSVAAMSSPVRHPPMLLRSSSSGILLPRFTPFTLARTSVRRHAFLIRTTSLQARLAPRCKLTPSAEVAQPRLNTFDDDLLPQLLQQAEAAGFASPFVGLTPNDYSDFRRQQQNPWRLPSVSYILSYYAGSWQRACSAAGIDCTLLTVARALEQEINAESIAQLLKVLNNQSDGKLTMKGYVKVGTNFRKNFGHGLPNLLELQKHCGSWRCACLRAGFAPYDAHFYHRVLRAAYEWNLEKGRKRLTICHYTQFFQEEGKHKYKGGSLRYLLLFFGSWRVGCQELGIIGGEGRTGRRGRSSDRTIDAIFANEDLLHMYRQGDSMEAIGTKLGLTREAVRCRLNKVSTPEERRQSNKEKTLERYIEAYERTLDVASVAATLRVSKQCVLRKLKQADIDFTEDPQLQSMRGHIALNKKRNDEGHSGDLFEASETLTCLQMAAAHFRTDTLSLVKYRRNTRIPTPRRPPHRRPSPRITSGRLGSEAV
ncbi:hypothetical protein CYMTET_20925 [Cymbomonas tetramitiformis]|uniref:Uncharacterized protein n=1 Tax=Cymbomonas tetramitiformis TaxID=36881 RepID=A0AAE0G343_9CHLO|nr:hypothetical protein CYMTET_20925 [Cymbomonas tetramitiformis]